MHNRLTWKRRVANSTAVPSTRFDETELAQILYQVYLKMFQHEDVKQLLSKVNLQAIRNSSLLHYHRGSLASFLRFVKRTMVVDWNKMMSVLIGLIEQDTSLLLGNSYIQELYLQLYIHDLYTLPAFEDPSGHMIRSQVSNSLSEWKNIPTVVCITFKVPRAKLDQITKVPWNKLGTPILHGILQSSTKFPGPQWQNIFASLQLAFGEISSSGSRHDDGFRVTVTEDVHGWKGHSPLIVSFLVPSCIVMQEPRTATVALAIQSTPQSVLTFRNLLGLEMNIYKTTLENEDHVYVTKFRPNLLGHASVCNFKYLDHVANKLTNEEVATTVQANVDLKTRQKIIDRSSQRTIQEC